MSVPEETSTTGQASGNERQKASGNAFLNWLLVRDGLIRARERAATLTLEQREALRRAKVAFELGEFALAPGNALRSGSGVALASDLFRQSIYWVLRSRSSVSGQSSLEAVWAAADGDLVSSLGALESELAELGALVRSSFIELAEGSVEHQRATVELLRRSAARLIRKAQTPLWELEWCKLKRLMRVLALAIVCLVPLTLGAVWLLTKPDLAKGKPWRTSSVELVCHPEKSECGGAATDILFHTKMEDSPWFEYDFGTPLAFSSLTVRNRTDYGIELSVPLVAEVSNDRVTYKEIARRTDSFITWQPSFSTQHARYLRLRVLRRTFFHLEAIKVHP